MELEPTGALTLSGPRLLLLTAPIIATTIGALLSGRGDAHWRWRVARVASLAALLLSLASAATVAIGGAALDALARADALTALMQTLIGFLGWVIVRYSASYLDGEPRERLYVGAMLWTLSAVGVVVITNHLALLLPAWMVTSVTLHRLLTFFAHRPGAILAAHKKFLIARVADGCMLAGFVGFTLAFADLRLDHLARSVDGALPLPASVGIVLIVVAALLRGASVPAHGWLMQVMEAPTPVSALLHAGVVNIGGFVLLRLAPLVNASLAARTLLVLVGTCTLVVSALVMITRVSAKGRLAWSTSAQLALMFIECGMGAWGLALLHLIAHSLYKAYAFLSVGETVRRTMVGRLAYRPNASLPVGRRVTQLAIRGVSAVLLSALAAMVWFPLSGAWTSPGDIVLAVLLPLSLAPLMRTGGLAPALRSGATVFALANVYFATHRLAERWIDVTPVASSWWLAAIVAAGFAAVGSAQLALACQPSARIMRRLYPWFAGGLFLDERLSRAMFALVPPRDPRLARVDRTSDGRSSRTVSPLAPTFGGAA